MKTIFYICSLAVALLNSHIPLALAAPKSDQITQLPGWPPSLSLPSRQYSGYFNISDTPNDQAPPIHLHYWFVEAEQDPENAPVVFWFNGGPGCSSLDGFFYEHGPFELISSDKAWAVNGYALQLRPYRWNRIAHMVYVEAPVGVGFSYHDKNLYNNDDDNTAARNLLGVEKFFELFPEYLKHDLFLTGESYAGIYVPTLAEALLQSVEAGTYKGATLKGIGVGNGCTGTEIGICGYYNNNLCRGLHFQSEFVLNLAFVDTSLKNKVAKACDWAACDAAGVLPSTAKYPLSDECLKLLDDVSLSLSYTNVYNVYGSCKISTCKVPENKQVSKAGPLQVSPLAALLAKAKEEKRLQEEASEVSATSEERELSSTSKAYRGPSYDDDISEVIRGPVGCIDSEAATAYVMSPIVQKALHVRAPGYCWAICSQVPGFSYTSTRKNLPRDTYPYLIGRTRVVIYNGDFDACVPYVDNQAWTEEMGLSPVKAWAPWWYFTEDNSTQIAGYHTTYDVTPLIPVHQNPSNHSTTTTTTTSSSSSSSQISLQALPGKAAFEFITVRGAGHMVPTDTPIQALELLARIIGLNRDNVNEPYLMPPIDLLGASNEPTCSYVPGSPVVAALVITVVMTFIVLSLTIFCLSLQIKRLNNRLKRTQDDGDDIEMSTGGSRRPLRAIWNPVAIGDGESVDSGSPQDQISSPIGHDEVSSTYKPVMLQKD